MQGADESSTSIMIAPVDCSTRLLVSCGNNLPFCDFLLQSCFWSHRRIVDRHLGCSRSLWGGEGGIRACLRHAHLFLHFLDYMAPLDLPFDDL